MLVKIWLRRFNHGNRDLSKVCKVRLCREEWPLSYDVDNTTARTVSYKWTVSVREKTTKAVRVDYHQYSNWDSIIIIIITTTTATTTTTTWCYNGMVIRMMSTKHLFIYSLSWLLLTFAFGFSDACQWYDKEVRKVTTSRSSAVNHSTFNGETVVVRIVNNQTSDHRKKCNPLDDVLITIAK